MKKNKHRRQQYQKKKKLLKTFGITKKKKSRRKKYKIKKFVKNKNNRLVLVLIVAIFLLIINIILISYETKIEAEAKEKEKIQAEKLKKLEEKIKKEKESIKMGNIVFLGDSITKYYDLEKYYDVPIVNSGTVGWSTDNILNDLDSKVYQYDVKKLFLLIGTNDLEYGKDTTYIVNNISKIVENIKSKENGVKLYIQSVYPINNTDDERINHPQVGKRNNKDIMDLNDKITKYCEKNRITYINMYDKLVDEQGNLKLEYTKEGLHISDDGYEVITNELKRYIGR